MALGRLLPHPRKPQPKNPIPGHIAQGMWFLIFLVSDFAAHLLFVSVADLLCAMCCNGIPSDVTKTTRLAMCGDELQCCATRYAVLS
eukprot:385028-Rhodomonas_salina.2